MPALPTTARATLACAVADRPAALALALLEGVGSVRWRTLVDAADGDARQALGRAAAPATADRVLRDADGLLERARRAGVSLHLLGDAGYPAALLDLPDPPAALWWAGRPDALSATPAVAVVGTRAPTSYGVRTARALATALARAGVSVVSGMARGIDAEAHQAALDAMGDTVAVLGTGADVPYPAANRALHARLRARGAIVSEAPPGALAAPGAFPRRNRIIAALARVTVVVEAGTRSGALITAGVAAELGRTVAALPGPIDAPTSSGANALLRDGAQVLTSVQDLLALAGASTSAPAMPRVAQPSACASEPEGLAPDERAVWLALAGRSLDPDTLVWQTGLPAGRCIAAVTTLELAGLLGTRPTGELERR